MAEDDIADIIRDLDGGGRESNPDEVLLDADSLRLLDLSGNTRTQDVKQFATIKKLSLFRSELVRLPEELLDFPSLEDLELTRWPMLSSLPSSIDRLCHLKILKITLCGMEQLPDSLGRLASLEEFELTLCQKLASLPSSMDGLCHLKILKIVECAIEQFPESLGRLASLEEFELTRCQKLAFLPSSMDGLCQLKSLKIVECAVERLPESLGRLASLECLHVSDCPKLACLPKSIGGLVHLANLVISHCGLVELPKALGDLVALKSLNASSNRLTAFPDFVLGMKNLQKVYLANQEVEVRSGMSIKELPLQLAENQSILKLDLSGNPMERPPMEICQQGIDAIKAYLNDISRGVNFMCADTINLIGDTGAGKTSIAQSLLCGRPTPSAVSDRTPVMNQFRATVGNKLVYINDFGGHEIYQSVLPIFLPTNGLVLVAYDMTWDATSQQQEVRKWMLTVLEKSEKARVIVVGTHADKIIEEKRASLENQMNEYIERLLSDAKDEIESHMCLLKLHGDDCSRKEKLLRNSLAVVKAAEFEVVSLSCAEPDPAKGLERLLSLLSQKLKPCVNMPASWALIIRNILESLSNTSSGYLYLTFQQIREGCRNYLEGNYVDDVIKVIVPYLASTSQVIWLESHEVLADVVFHRPKIIIDVCKRVLNHDPYSFELMYGEDAYEQYCSGYVTEALMQNLLFQSCKEFLSEDVAQQFDNYKVMMELLKHCNLVSKVKDDKSGRLYVVPYNLPSMPPTKYEELSKSRFVPSIAVQLQFVGSLIPRAFFETNLANVLSLVCSWKTDPMVWKNGVVFRRDGVFFVMVRLDHKSVLEISTYADSEKENMWCLLQPVLQSIHSHVAQSWKGAAPFCMVMCPGCRPQEKPKKLAGKNATTLEELVSPDRPPDALHWYCYRCHKDIPRSLIFPFVTGQILPSVDQRDVKRFFKDLRRCCKEFVAGSSSAGGHIFATQSMPEAEKRRYEESQYESALPEKRRKRFWGSVADVARPEKSSPPSASYLAISSGSAISDLSLDAGTRVDIEPSGVITIFGAESKSPASEPHVDERVRSNRTVSPPELYELMQKLMQKLGKFSYYVTTDLDFIVMQEDPASMDFNTFKSQVEDFLGACFGSVYKLLVSPETAGGRFAAYERSTGSGIYACMSESNEWSQVLGMYLLYENVVYWVTTSHGLLFAMGSARSEYPKEGLGRKVLLERQSTDTLPDVYMYSSLHPSVSPPRSKIRLPVIYPCFAHEGYLHQLTGSNVKLAHTIDIMIGTLPFTLYDLTDPEEIHRLSSAGIMCECSICHQHNKRQQLCPTCITSIANFPQEFPPAKNKTMYYDLSALEDPNVELCCRLSQCNDLAKGKIRSVNSSGIVLRVVEEKTANNVIVIEPHHGNRPCDSPAIGHSGSIWYQDKGHTREAVAVTIGIMNDERGRGKCLWLAAPLCASLYALSKEYPNTFGDPSLFKPLSCFGCHPHPGR